MLLGLADGIETCSDVCRSTRRLEMSGTEWCRQNRACNLLDMVSKSETLFELLGQAGVSKDSLTVELSQTPQNCPITACERSRGHAKDVPDIG